MEELSSTGLFDQTQLVLNLVLSAMMAVRWLEANAETSKLEMTVQTHKKLSNVKFNHSLDLFRTTSKVMSIPEAIEMIWARQRWMPWFRAVKTWSPINPSSET